MSFFDLPVSFSLDREATYQNNYENQQDYEENVSKGSIDYQLFLYKKINDRS